MTQASWVALRTYHTGLEADAARLILEEAEIPVLIPGHQVGIFGPGFAGSQPGGITLMVPDAAVDQAREALGMEAEEEA